METRIRAPYLRALESEDLNSLPNSVVARGFLRNYASYLGLDAQEAVSRYAGLAAPADSAPAPVEPMPIAVDMFRPVPLHNGPGVRRPRRGLSYALIIIPVVLALLAAWGWWNYPTVAGWLAQLTRPRPTPTPPVAGLSTDVAIPAQLPTTAATRTIAPIVSTSRPSAGSTVRPSPTQSPTPTATRSSPVYTGVFVELYFSQKSWIQVTVDGTREFQGELEAESRRSWYGNNRVELRIGNAGGVEVTVNGQNLGTLGQIGEVVDRVFETAGPALQLTVGITPVDALTPIVTDTAEPLTPAPTATVSPTATTAISP